MDSILLLAQEMDGGGEGGGLIGALVGGLFMLAILAGYWKCFEKAGEPGWTALIPFYNFYVCLRISGLGLLYFFLMFVPLINIPVMFYACLRFARAFGAGVMTALGMIFLPFVVIPMLGFGGARYQRG